MTRAHTQPEAATSSFDKLPYHILSGEAFGSLASGRCSPAVMAELRRGEWSRRLLLLRGFHEAVRADTALMGPLPDAGQAWSVLERAQQTAPDVVSEILMYPGVGAWLAYTLRRHRGGTSSEAPPFVDFGQLHALAVAVAAAVGISFTTRVPVRDGHVLIPGRGMASFGDSARWDVAEVEVDRGRVVLRCGGQQVAVPDDPSEDAIGWWALRQLKVGGHDGLVVWLDDLDSLRDLADPVPPARLTPDQVTRWHELLQDAWSILAAEHTEDAAAMRSGFFTLVPLPAGDGWDTRSASTGDAFGAIMCSPPPDALTLAVSLVHEFMHIKLGALMHLLTFVEGGKGWHYAPWRDDPRPLGGLLQGVYAFFGIAGFWRRHRSNAVGVEAEIANFEYVYARAQAAEGLATVRAAEGLTSNGRLFTDALATELESWFADSVPGEAGVLAKLIADSHRAGWRIRHCQPDKDTVATLVQRWGQGELGDKVTVGQSTVRPDHAMRHWSQGRLGLARRRIVAPDYYLDAAGDHWADDLTDSDRALLAGEAHAAVKGFADQVLDDPDAVDAWTGLALALHATQDESVAFALDRPEVVRAVYRGIEAARGVRESPVDVMVWTGRSVQTITADK